MITSDIDWLYNLFIDFLFGVFISMHHVFLVSLPIVPPVMF